MNISTNIYKYREKYAIFLSQVADEKTRRG